MKLMTIQRFLLPTTFPSSFVPDAERHFMRNMIGRSLADATAQAAARGLQPSVSPLPTVHPDAHAFTVVVQGLVIPWCVILGETQVVVH